MLEDCRLGNTMERKKPIKKDPSAIQYARWFGVEIAYSLPPGHTRAKNNRYPVLCFLHGRNECSVGPENNGKPIMEALGVHGPLAGSDYRPQRGDFSQASELARTKFIVVSPQLPNPGGPVWSRKNYRKAVIQTVRKIHKEQNGDPNRTYLTGFSYGGDGVFGIATHKKEMKWTALWVVDPTKVPRKLLYPTFLCIGSEARQNTVNYMKLGFVETPVFSMEEHVAYSNVPADNYLYRDYGKNHPQTSWAAYADDTIYNWLLRLNRKHLQGRAKQITVTHAQ